MRRITIFHYHLQTGGITQVIRDSIYSLIRQSKEEMEIRIVSGRQQGTEEFSAGIREVISSHLKEKEENRQNPESIEGPRVRVNVEVLESIGYIDAMQDPPETEALKAILLQRYGGTIWWIHNYHIGKNPAFTRALIEIAGEHPEQQLIFHIHDFPESGRFENLKKIRNQLGTESLYPVYPNLRYIVINGRDRTILQKAGIPEELLHSLNNPISFHDSGFIDFWQIHDKINRWAKGESYRWNDGGKLILYPVRAIRRKNILEAALITNLLETPANLLVTLPGTSQQEKQYSDLLSIAYREKLIPGVWAVGTRLGEFETGFAELTRSADLILSSSVQEGFGYLFINSLLWGVPLVARWLDILQGVENHFSPGSSHFYREMTIPLIEKDRKILQESFSDTFKDLKDTFPDALLKPLKDEIFRMFQKDTIDFSFLSPRLQYEHLRDAVSSDTYRESLRELNAPLLAVTDNLLRGGRPRENSGIRTAFGSRAHVSGIFRILNSFSREPESIPVRKNNETDRKVLGSFIHKDYFRPLYHTGDDD